MTTTNTTTTDMMTTDTMTTGTMTTDTMTTGTMTTDTMTTGTMTTDTMTTDTNTRSLAESAVQTSESSKLRSIPALDPEVGSSVGTAHFRWAVAFTVCVVAAFQANAAVAHDPPDALNVVSDGENLIVSTSRGLVVGRQGEYGWGFVCREAVGLGVGEIPGLEINDAGELLISTTGGLGIGDIEGCVLEPVVPFEEFAVGDLQRVPAATDTFVLATSQVDADNGVYRSEDGGVTWQLLGTLEPGVFYSRILVSSADPDVLHVGGVRLDLDAGRAIYFVRFSDDGWTSYVEREIPVNPEREFRALLVGIDEADPARVFARVETFASAMAPDLLLALDGETWTPVLEANQISGFASTDVGYLVTTEDGVFGSTDGVEFELANAEVDLARCVRQSGGAIWLCGDDLAAFAVAEWGPGGAIRTEFLFTDVRAEGCPNQSDLCAENWNDWTNDLFPDGVPDGDAGMTPADAGADPDTQEDGGSSGGGRSDLCSAAPSRRASLALIAMIGLGLGALRRKRRLARTLSSRLDHHGE